MHPLCTPQCKTAVVIFQTAGAADLRYFALLAPVRAYLVKERTCTPQQPRKQDANNKSYDKREGLKWVLHYLFVDVALGGVSLRTISDHRMGNGTIGWLSVQFAAVRASGLSRRPHRPRR